MPQSFSAFCASLGCPLRNPAWSWCGSSQNRERAIFTIWADGLNDGTYELWRVDAPYNDRNGAKEMKRVLDDALQTNMQTLGVICIAVDPTADPRKRKKFIRDQLLVLSLTKETKRIVAKVIGYVPYDLALPQNGNFPLLQPSPIAEQTSHSKLPDAINDLDSAPDGNQQPSRTKSQTFMFLRDSQVRNYVLNRAKGLCEYCGSEGFLKPDGTRYLEAHHIITLAKQGPDTTKNVIALCAGHHREAHFGKDRVELEKKFQKILSKKVD